MKMYASPAMAPTHLCREEKGIIVSTKTPCTLQTRQRRMNIKHDHVKVNLVSK